MNDESILSQIIEFFRELVASLGEGYLFFGSPFDIVRYIIDVAIVTFLFYWMLLFIRQTRAWQLIKGIVLILFAVLLFSVFGLQMVNFIFNRLLYVFAIFFIILSSRSSDVYLRPLVFVPPVRSRLFSVMLRRVMIRQYRLLSTRSVMHARR